MKRILFPILLFSSIAVVQAQVNKTDRLQNLEKNSVIYQDGTVTATLKSSSRLFGSKDDLTSVILIIPSGSNVQVLGSDSTFLNVVFEDNEGYIFKRHAVIDVKPVQPQTANQAERSVKEEQPAQQQQVSRFSYLENKYGSNLAALINSGKIWKGMSAEMVQDSWGSPQKINRVINGNVVKEEWIYNNTWLYIENDMLTEWGAVRK